MSTDRNLTGAWEGIYYQNNRPHPISAELDQEGETLTGSMTDGVTERSSSLFEATSEAGLAPGADEQIVARLRELLPDDPRAPIRYVSHLPPESTLQGRVDGSRVSFLKSYQGVSFGGYQVGERLVVQETDHHCVEYSGTLSPDGRAIEGRWWIEANPTRRTPRVEGSFHLKRADST